MLKAFSNQLKRLANDPTDRFHYHVLNRLGKKATADLEEHLKQFVLLMPTLVSRIYSLWKRMRPTSKVKEIGSFFLAYLYHPQDFLPEDEHNGLFGYLDDAYLTALVYELVLEELTHSEVQLLRVDEELLKKVIGLKRKAAAVIPEEAANIQYMVGEILEGEDETFSRLFQKDKLLLAEGDSNNAYCP